MSIIWCGGEDLDFQNGGPVASNNSSGWRRTAYSRTALLSGSYYSFAKSTIFSPMTSGWFHCTAVRTFSNVANHIGIMQYSNNKGFFITSTISTSKLRLTKYDGSSYNELAVESGNTFSGICIWDLYFSGLGTNDTIILWNNGMKIIEYTGDLSLSGMTGLDSVYLFGQNATTGANGIYSEIIVADEDTRLMSLKTLVPNAAGDTNDWVNDYTSIDEETIQTIDAVYIDSVDKDFQCNLTGMPTGDFQIKAVKCTIFVSDSLASRAVQIGIKTNSVVHLGSTKNLDSSWETKEELFNNNPETSDQFTPDEINALQLNVRSKSAI